jgi:type I restriction enzyme M protein
MAFLKKSGQIVSNRKPAMRDQPSDRAWRAGEGVVVEILVVDKQLVRVGFAVSGGSRHGWDAVQPDQLHPPQHVVGKVGQADPGADPAQEILFGGQYELITWRVSPNRFLKSSLRLTSIVESFMQPTTAQSLGALIKSARDIMRKDKGLNGDLDRLPMLTWIMFLKFLDDLETQREGEAKLAAKRFKAAIEAPYRWRDWAARADGITGDELLGFINSEETMLPGGERGAGLFRYLRTLTSANGDDRREVVATVFRGVQNRMASGYLLRDVVNKLNGIHFTASEELHTLGALYESLLREMRDAAGDSGEFYTPRPVVRLMVAVTDPRLGETVLDPACGTGGFLVEAYSHLAKQVKTVADRKVLQGKSLFGGEAKTLPYLLCQMNLLLHGLDSPQIDPGNSLRFKLTEVGERDRVDVILTNPPFGGEEEKGIQGNFPEGRQTAETAMLFLQLIMRKLRRQGGKARAAVVVPNGTLFGDGVCARIKEEMLKDFNLHTIVRLPNGVFAPYTSIPTNILFFDRSGPTQEVWYWEQPLPEGRKNYTKTAPIQYEDFAPLVAWWGRREENDRAWKVPAAELLAAGCNLDRKNPRAKEDIAHLPPAQLAASILAKEMRVAEIVRGIQGLLGGSE